MLPVEPLARAAARRRHDHEGVEEGVAVRVAELAELAAHVGARDLLRRAQRLVLARGGAVEARHGHRVGPGPREDDGHRRPVGREGPRRRLVVVDVRRRPHLERDLPAARRRRVRARERLERREPRGLDRVARVEVQVADAGARRRRGAVLVGAAKAQRRVRVRGQRLEQRPPRDPHGGARGRREGAEGEGAAPPSPRRRRLRIFERDVGHARGREAAPGADVMQKQIHVQHLHHQLLVRLPDGFEAAAPISKL